MKRKALVLIALLCLTVPAANSSRVLPLNLPELVEDAGKIFIGKCIDVKTGKDPETGLIVTWTTFKVIEGIKGELEETETIKQIGGTHEGITATSFTPEFRVGEEVLLFVYAESRIGLTTAVGLNQGVFNIYTDLKTGKKKVTNGMPDNVLFSPQPVRTSKKRGYKIKSENDPIIAKAKTLELEPFVDSIRAMIKETK